MKKEQAVALIKELSDANGVSGFENDVVKIVQKHTKAIGPQKTDAIKNLYIERAANTKKRPLLQFDAHSDEVGFIVQAIKPNGLLKFLPLGGWIPNNISAQKVRVKNRNGQYVNGIVTSKPPHFMSPAERNRSLTIDDLAIDVGARSQEELEELYQIDIGAPVVPAVVCEYNEATNLFLGKAFDCRIGCACMIDVLDELQGAELAVDVVATLTSQEEVGERGALVAAKQVKADLAIVFEGCPADDTSTAEYLIQSAMGKGPMLRYFDVSMITNPEFQKYAIDIAREHKLPIQVSVRSGGGTNGSAINEVQGAPAIVVGIPVRYAHTHHCYVDFKDYEAAKKLVVALVKALDQEKITALLQSI
jgi:putative aminopeptidase FrvX